MLDNKILEQLLIFQRILFIYKFLFTIFDVTATNEPVKALISLTVLGTNFLQD